MGFTETMLWISHLGMAVEGAVFLKTLLPGSGLIFLTGSWMLLNDLMDYGVGLHPYLFTSGQEPLALAAALALTLLITAVLVLQKRYAMLK
ncbi:MAG: DUF1405 domain-containing protein [Peptococcaceae bacterium]|nr:DUF1405 domain-containing protein [Peptococcaceae bacterium]